MTTPGRRRNQRTAIGIGLLVTALSAGAYQLGLLDWLELKVFDARFHLIPASDAAPDCQQIAHVDIDDASLAEVGRWPWPRTYLADIVRELTACQAKAIVLDIIMPEPQEPRLATSPFGRNYDLVGRTRYVHVESAPDIYDDDDLADAMRQSKRVFLAMHFEVGGAEEDRPADASAGQAEPQPPPPPPAELTSPEGKRWAALVRQRVEWLVRHGGRGDDVASREDPHPALSQGERDNLMDPHPALSQGERDNLMHPHPALSQGERDNLMHPHPALSQGERDNLMDPHPALSQGERDNLMDPHPALSQGERVNTASRPEESYPSALAVAGAIWAPAAHEAGPEQDLIFNCYREAVAMRELDRCSLGRSAAPSVAAVSWPEASGAFPPIPELAQAAAGAGFVTYQADSDGEVRAMPPLMRYHGRIYPELDMLVSCWLKGVDLDKLVVQDNRLVLPGPVEQDLEPVPSQPGKAVPAARIPLDRRHRMFVNWHWHQAEAGQEPWKGIFGQDISARDVLTIGRNRRLIVEKQNQLKLAAAVSVSLAFGEKSKENESYFDACDTIGIIAAQREVAKDESFAQDALIDKMRIKAGFEEQAATDLARQRAEFLARPPGQLSAAERQLLRDIDGISEPLFEPDKVRGEIEVLEKAIAENRARLRALVSGRVCYVGSTATSAADFAITPVFPLCPGVIVHSNVMNTIVTGGFIAPVPGWLNLAAILVCGLAATGLAARFGPRLSGPAVLATMLAVAAANVLVLFGRFHELLVLFGPLAGMGLAGGSIMLYRWLGEAKQRRLVTTVLGSYTSPAVARRLADQPGLLALAGERRVVTCMFTDLKGFTPISEQLGPERTVALLNRYLGRMSEVLQRHEGYINKFLGDGIFAIFGAPDVQLDHARRAAAAALDCREELRFLCRELADVSSPQLVMRIGVATGPTIVGDCGTSLKRDYTAVGDTVNLASRLEGANKFFGTSILLSAATAVGLESHFLFRPLGRIVVVGQQQPVGVVELVDRLSESGDAGRCWADRFGMAVELYGGRKFAEAAAAFEALKSVRPADKPADIYLKLCRSASAQPPGDDWSGAIVMTEK